MHIDVRQDGLTSAYMFRLYLDDILRQIDEQPFGCMSRTRKGNVQAYVDVTALVRPPASGLRHLTSTLRKSLQLNEPVINGDNTKTLVFH